MRLLLIAMTLLVVSVATARTAAAQKTCDFLVPPSGGAFDVPVNPVFLTNLQFPEKITSANTSALKDYKITRSPDETAYTVIPININVQPANINIVSGSMRVSVSIRVVKDPKDACAMVSFRATSEEEAFQRKVEEEVAKRTAKVEAELEAIKRDQAARVRDELDGVLADRAMARLEIQRLSAVDRSDEGVVVWVMRAVYLGNDLLINIEIENRARGPYRVADIELREGDKNRATSARLASGAAGGLVGTVLPGAKVRGVVVVRDGAKLSGKDLTLVTRTPDGKGSVTVRRLGVR